jgi:hypothetical protein
MSQMIDQVRRNYGYVWTFKGQLGSVNSDNDNLLAQLLREVDRKMETGAGYPCSQNKHRIIVQHDLTLHTASEQWHYSGKAKQLIGERFWLAIREHVLGESVDGTGPRLASITRPSSSQIQIDVDKDIAAPLATDATAYDGYFSVLNINNSQLAISSITRPTARRILVDHAAESGQITLRYMPPRNIPAVTNPANAIFFANCVRGVTSDALPLPAMTVKLN